MSDLLITGRNERGEVVTEVITEEMLNDPFVREYGYITRGRYSTVGRNQEPATLNQAIRDVQQAWDVLMKDLLLSMLKLVFLPVRFFLWLNGDK